MTTALDPQPLTTLRPGAIARIAAVADADAAALAQVGLFEGGVVTIERRLPLGGPVLLDVGPVRIAVARAVAARTLVVPAR